MAVPLRKVAGEYVAYGTGPGSPQRWRETEQTRELNAKRLIRRQVKSNAEFRRTAAWLFLGMASVLFLLSMSYIFVKAGVSRLNYQINTLQTENERILLENEKIQGQIAELRSLDRIEVIASQELGMVKNEAVEYMVMSSTIVAEGKIKADENQAEEEPENSEPLAALVDFFSGFIK
jgi:cell division protein FtsL